MPQFTLLVLDDPVAPYLRVLDQIPQDVRMLAASEEAFFDDAVGEAEVIFTGLGRADLLRKLWPRACRLRWVHSFSAGVEGILFPELVESPVVLTNARGVFRRSLAEFAIAAALYFAKDLRRMMQSQEAARWDPFDVEELHGRTLGIVGYGEIGREIAARAHCFGMRVLALRRRPELVAGDPLVDAAFASHERLKMIPQCDYLVVAAALTPATRGLIGRAELAMMKPGAVLINVGRGPVVEEQALVETLGARRIRGAALDVFDVEPLPAGHPFYRLGNVLLSPHCADHTKDWQELAMRFFVENLGRFAAGQPLANVVDKRAGY